MSLKLSFHFPEESFLAGRGGEGKALSSVTTLLSNKFDKSCNRSGTIIKMYEIFWDHMCTYTVPSAVALPCGENYRSREISFSTVIPGNETFSLPFEWIVISRLNKCSRITSRNNLIELKFCKLNIRRTQRSIVSHIKSVPGWDKRMHKLLFE